MDVIYRRVDDDFSDPLIFRSDSALGCAGLFNAYRAGNVTVTNAFGTGLADDKAVYAYVPKIIRYYLGERRDFAERGDLSADRGEGAAACAGEPGQAGGEGGGRERRVWNADRFRNRRRGSGEEFARQIEANPRNYIAQPTLDFSRAPCLIGNQLEPRHVDLRPLYSFWRQGETSCREG